MPTRHRRSSLPSWLEISHTLLTLPARRRRWLVGTALVAIIGLFMLLWQINQRLSIEVAARGGELTEGVIGTPRFINPLLAASDADRDLTALVYSGLMRVAPDNSLIPDLADRYEISPDGLIYTFTLKPDLVWPDGESLTSADVEFTVTKAQEPALKSPKRAAWEGVRVLRPDNQTISFVLKQPYPSFLEIATLGILPKHIWGQLETDAFAFNKFNIESIGSGPYQIKKIKTDTLGLPEYYELVPFRQFALGEPKISQLRIRFYANEAGLLEAYERGEIQSFSAAPASLVEKLEKQGARVLKSPLPRVFGVFFNQNKAPVLVNAEVREALDLAVNKQAIINEVLRGYGVAADGPLPTFQITASSTDTAAPAATTTDRLTAAKELLTKKGWKWSEERGLLEKMIKKETVPLTFSLAAPNTPELLQATELIKEQWEKLGAKIELKVFEVGDLSQNVIRPREYESLFFGEIVGREPDLFSFWHSKQRSDPGLNIALYTNTTADKLLEQVRNSSNPTASSEVLMRLDKIISADYPAVFVYSPYFLYVVPPAVKRVQLATINTPADRFLNIYDWFINTDHVWPIFANN